jgi:hypothetical protein
MPHYYVSIPGLDHKVFKYAGYVHPLNEDYYKQSFEEYGITGLPGGEWGPCKAISFDEYKADRILEDGTPYGDQPYHPKQIILTKRDEKGKVWRVMWSQKSSPEEEKKAQVYCEEEGWLRHVFQVGDQHAWDRALENHEEVEKHEIDLDNPDNWIPKKTI